MLIVWAAWTIVHTMRLGLALVRLQRTKRSAAPFPRDREARLAMWTRMRECGRPARLVTSTDVYCAAVFGCHPRLIAVAPDAIDRLTDGELDQIVLHEYAHIQRRDDLAIVAQRIISAVAGLHPAVWWLDRVLTIDREVACDDWVVAYAGARRRYARCLVKLASSARSRRPGLAPGALRSRSQLSIRVAALLDARRSVALAPSRASFLVALPTVLALVLACVWVPIVGVTRHRPLQIFAPPTGAVETAARAVPVLPVPVRAPRLGFVQSGGPRPEPSGPRRLQERSPSALQESSWPGTIVRVPIEDASAALDPLPAISLAQLDLGVEPAGTPGQTLAAPVHEAPWRAAATAGLAIGSGSRYAALKTAAAFSRLGKSFTNP
jgi:hypothetical protein